jgi:hypothetical protein
MRNEALGAAIRIRAIDVLNRMDGLYVHRFDIRHAPPLDLSRLTPEELAALERLLSKAQTAGRPPVH